RREKTKLTAQMRRELEAIDAALAGEAVGAGDARLAELTRALRGLRPQPSRQFARALDARAARGFRRERPALARDGGGAGSKSRAGWQRRRTLLLFPALGLAIAVVVLAAVSLSSSGRHRAQPLPGAALSGRPALTPAVSAPA